LKVDVRELAREQHPRRFAENSGAVSGSAVGRPGPAMDHRRDGLQGENHEIVRGRPAQIRDEADAASVVFLVGRSRR